MTLLYKNKSIAKVLETSSKTIVMFEYQTRFFESWQAAIRFLMSNGYSF